MSYLEYTKEINKASRHEKLVFFVGAGVSTLSNYPRWSELVDTFYENLYGKKRDPSTEHLTSDDYLRIPQMFYDSLDINNKFQYDKVLEKIFSVEKSPNSIHYKILSLNPVHIITTNYDNLLEKTYWQRGKYYTKISSERNVSGAISSRYLVKVHGDFTNGYKAANVVLKESDYINYEQNYPLISNLMKTIVATHTIVFIGYSLGDYNINLLLNWVKQLQKDSYEKPFFIRTDPEEITDIDRSYYENKGLRIIDSAKLVKSDSNDYLKRYNATMDMLVDTQNNKNQMNDNGIIDFIYQKIKPLTKLNFIRKIDIKYVFDEDYLFELNGQIINNKISGQNYMERFFEIHGSSGIDLPKEDKQKFDLIKQFFSDNNIYGMNTSDNSLETDFTNYISNPFYNGDYEKINNLIEANTDDLKELYDKAFYLANLGEWENSYDLYTEVISKSNQNENLWLHFLSQINRYHLYQSIKQTEKFLNSSLGFLVHRQRYKPFTASFLSRIESELKNFKINDVFNSMPEEFQENYKILEFMSDNKFLYDDTVQLFNLSNKVRKSIKKNSISLGGLTSENKILYSLYETVKFLYENHMWSISFSEYKNYVRNAITLQFEKADYDITREKDSLNPLDSVDIPVFFIDYFDYLCISNTFNIEELKLLEKSYDISNIKIKEEAEIISYLYREISNLENHYVDDVLKMNILTYNTLMVKVKSAIYFSKYLSLEPESITKIINAILNLIPLRELDNGEKYHWCERILSNNNNLPDDTILIIENFIVKEAQSRKDEKYSEMTKNDLSSTDFAGLIHHFKPDYISEHLSDYASKISSDSNNEVTYIYKFSLLLSLNSREYINELKTVNNISDVIDSINANKDKTLIEFEDIITDYISKIISAEQREEEQGLKVYRSNNYVIYFAKQYFLEEFKSEKMKEFQGVFDEYDMFIDPLNFDYSKFNPVWLKYYSDKLISKMVENIYMRNQIIIELKNQLLDTKDNRFINILLKHFVK